MSEQIEGAKLRGIWLFKDLDGFWLRFRTNSGREVLILLDEVGKSDGIKEKVTQWASEQFSVGGFAPVVTPPVLRSTDNPAASIVREIQERLQAAFDEVNATRNVSDTPDVYAYGKGHGLDLAIQIVHNVERAANYQKANGV